MSPSEEQALAPGTVVDSFRIESVLGVGGFGITYRAHDMSLQRPVALKEYFPSGLAQRDSDDTTLGPRTHGDHDSFAYGLKRFLDEARTLAMFRNRNIVQVNSYLQANGTAYLVMDYEDGRTLSDVLHQVGRLSRKQAMAVTVHILRGLREVHVKRFLHRDIKPGNILVRRSGPPVLLDFGAARLALERQAGDLTVMLTPGYAPIEQYGGEDRLGPWSDLYALGATVYHGAVGRAPLAATQRVSAMHDDEPDPVVVGLAKVSDRLGPTLERAVAWMLQLNAKDRPQTADEVLYELMPHRVTEGPLGDNLPTRIPNRPMREQPTELPSVGLASPTGSGLQDEDALADAESALADFLGPIARVLVSRAAKQVSDVKQLHTLLADELDDEGERIDFLKRLR